jgi:hypothetical protein
MTQNFWPIVSTVTSLATVIIGGLLARYIGGLLQNIKSDIRIAILELENRLFEKYATKDYVDQQVRLADRIDEGFAGINKRFRSRDGETLGVASR